MINPAKSLLRLVIALTERASRNEARPRCIRGASAAARSARSLEFARHYDNPESATAAQPWQTNAADNHAGNASLGVIGYRGFTAAREILRNPPGWELGVYAKDNKVIREGRGKTFQFHIHQLLRLL